MDSGDVVRFEALYPEAVLPRRQTPGAAGYDLHAYLKDRWVRLHTPSNELREQLVTRDLVLPPGWRALVPLGFRARLPEGYEAQLRLRSSVAWTRGLFLLNAPGTVDSDYADEWFVLVQNGAGVDVALRHGERFAQAVLARVATLPWVEAAVERTARAGGFGSTGA